MSVATRYPDIVPFLDTTDDYINEASEFTANGVRYVVVTQRGETDSGQLIFQYTEDGLEPLDADTSVDLFRQSGAPKASAMGSCSVSSAEDHATVAKRIVSAVDNFSSAKGPDGGNLACVWAVRHLVREELGRWITRTDGTAVFNPELRQCFGAALEENEVGAGGIIISPTEPIPGTNKRNVGHVGLLGPHTGSGNRLIYSNSSSKANWKQNFTLSSWIARYREKKGLKVYFYPLPLRSTPAA